MGDWMNAARLSDVVRPVNEQSPISSPSPEIHNADARTPEHDLIKGLSQLKARDGVVAVLGNHDYWSGPRAVRDVLVASDVSELLTTSGRFNAGQQNCILLV